MESYLSVQVMAFSNNWGLNTNLNASHPFLYFKKLIALILPETKISRKNGLKYPNFYELHQIHSHGGERAMESFAKSL